LLTAHELTIAYQNLRDRIEAILIPDQLAVYDDYHARLMHADVAATPDEQAMLDIIAAGDSS
jgi:hypothetical protein